MGEEGGEVMEMRFELFPARSLSLCLVEGVTNAAELREEVMKQKFEASFIDAAMVADVFHLQAAANKALYAHSKDALTTHGIHTELIFCMLGGRSISTALSTFGISSTSKALIVAIFDAKPVTILDVVSHIKGTSVPMSRLGEHTDLERIKKAYKISSVELSAPGVSLGDCAVCRIGVRDSM
eukprot:Tamp_23922.p1 GENE.Tamp_23922~~Tamp_23922.p1  ORF type:complete len:182 (+),score=41.59 Tamp_23922:2-547(+)